MPTLVDDEAPAKPATETKAPAPKPSGPKPAEPTKIDPKKTELKPAKPTAAVFPLSRPPDDPGPNGGGPDTVTGAQSYPSSRPTY